MVTSATKFFPSARLKVKHSVWLTLFMLLGFGCDRFRGGPDGPLIDPVAGISGTAEMLTVTQGQIVHEEVELVEFLGTADKTVIVDFWATWCGPCKMLGPELEKLALASGDDVVVIKVNVDVQQELAAHFQVTSIPDLRLFKGGKAVDTWVGFHSADEMLQRLKRPLALQ